MPQHAFSHFHWTKSWVEWASGWELSLFVVLWDLQKMINLRFCTFYCPFYCIRFSWCFHRETCLGNWVSMSSRNSGFVLMDGSNTLWPMTLTEVDLWKQTSWCRPSATWVSEESPVWTQMYKGDHIWLCDWMFVGGKYHLVMHKERSGKDASGHSLWIMMKLSILKVRMSYYSAILISTPICRLPNEPTGYEWNFEEVQQRWENILRRLCHLLCQASSPDR